MAGRQRGRGTVKDRLTCARSAPCGSRVDRVAVKSRRLRRAEMLAAGWKLLASLALVLFIGGTVGSAVILEGVARTAVVSDEQGERLRPLHRYAAAAMTLVMAVTIALLEPLVAGAPWWTSGDGDLVGALAIPFGVWLSLALGLAAAGSSVRSSWGTLVLVSAVVASSMLATVPMTLLLGDVYPDSGNLVVSLMAGFFAVPVLLGALGILCVRALWKLRPVRARQP